MGPFQYYRRLLGGAWRHSPDITQAILFFAFIIFGFIAWLIPAVAPMMPDVSGWQAATGVLVAIIIARLLLAPYWLYKEQAAELAASKAAALKLQEELQASDFVAEERGRKNAKIAVELEDAERLDAIHRAQLISDTRAIVAMVTKRGSDDLRKELEASASFYQLRPHLSAAFMKKLSVGMNDSIAVVAGSSLPEHAQNLLDELDRLEKEWGC
jgi:hypothetical protein